MNAPLALPKRDHDALRPASSTPIRPAEMCFNLTPFVSHSVRP